MQRELMVGALTSTLLAGCIATGYPPAYPPPQYTEDFAGAAVPYQIEAQARDGRIWVRLLPGTCRRFLVTAGAPPQLVAQGPCPHGRVNVPVGLWLPGQPPWFARTNPNGDVLFGVSDRVALGLSSEATGKLVIGRVIAGEVALQPLLSAALARAAPPTPVVPAPEPPPGAPSAVAPRPTLVPAPSSPERRQMTDGEVFLFASAVCLVKMKLVDKCEEKMGVAACSAASQFLSTGHVDVGEVGKDVAISKATEESDFAQDLLKLAEFLTCLPEAGSKLRELASEAN